MLFYAFMPGHDDPEKAGRIGVEHMVIYHGHGKRPEDSFGRYHLGTTKERKPLHIIRSGALVPEVFSPDSSMLVVSDRVKSLLADLPNLQFLPVVFDKLVNLSIAKGDFSLEKSIQALLPDSNLEEFLYDLPGAPDMLDTIGVFYEVICARYDAIAPSFQTCRRKRIHVSLGQHDIDQLRVEVCPEMFDAYPLIKEGITMMCSQRFFEIIDRYVDWDFYDIVKCET